MSNVKLEIGGREFSVAVPTGQEDHIARLGRLVDDKLRANGGVAGNSESRMLLLAALLMADEAEDMRKKDAPAAPAQAELAAPGPTVHENSADIARLCDGVEAAAARLEKLAEQLEQAAA